MNNYYGLEHRNVIDLAKRFIVPEKQALGHVLNCMKMQQPCSVIRLGDGEAKLLGYPDYIARERLKSQLAIWFGEKDLDDDCVLFLQKSLEESIEKSDVIGLPSYERLKQKDEDGSYTNDAVNCAILWAKIFNLYGETFFRKKIIVPAGFHHWLQKSKSIRRVFYSSSDVCFISHSFNLPDIFYDKFSMNSVGFFPVPAETWSRSSSVSDHYPERFRNLIKHFMHHSGKGKTYFIGAGVCGKIYSAMVKESGGVAIDMGAIIDGWNRVIPVQRGLLKNNEYSSTIDYLFD